MNKLIALGLAKPAEDADGKPLIDKDGNPKSIQALGPDDGPMWSYSGQLFEVYDTKLRGSDVWIDAVTRAGFEPKLTQGAHPGYGGGPAAAGFIGAPPDRVQAETEARRRLMQTLVPAIPESQTFSLPPGNPLRPPGR
jgi:hypothetical protein